MTEDVFKQLAEAGITKVTVTYSGSGDSGCLDEVKIDGINSEVLDIKLKRDFQEPIKDAAYKLLEEHHGGWEINEGSQGEIIFHLSKTEPTKFTINHQENYEAHHDSTQEGTI